MQGLHAGLYKKIEDNKFGDAIPRSGVVPASIAVASIDRAQLSAARTWMMPPHPPTRSGGPRPTRRKAPLFCPRHHRTHANIQDHFIRLLGGNTTTKTGGESPRKDSNLKDTRAYHSSKVMDKKKDLDFEFRNFRVML